MSKASTPADPPREGSELPAGPVGPTPQERALLEGPSHHGPPPAGYEIFLGPNDPSPPVPPGLVRASWGYRRFHMPRNDVWWCPTRRRYFLTPEGAIKQGVTPTSREVEAVSAEMRIAAALAAAQIAKSAAPARHGIGPTTAHAGEEDLGDIVSALGPMPIKLKSPKRVKTVSIGQEASLDSEGAEGPMPKPLESRQAAAARARATQAGTSSEAGPKAPAPQPITAAGRLRSYAASQTAAHWNAQPQPAMPLPAKGGRISLKMRVLEAAHAWSRAGKLRQRALTVLGVIASATDKESGTCRRTYQQLGDAVGLNKRTVCRALKDLETLGLIKRIARYGGRGTFRDASDIVLVDPPPVPRHRATRDPDIIATPASWGSDTSVAEDSLKKESPLRNRDNSVSMNESKKTLPGGGIISERARVELDAHRAAADVVRIDDKGHRFVKRDARSRDDPEYRRLFDEFLLSRGFKPRFRN